MEHMADSTRPVPRQGKKLLHPFFSTKNDDYPSPSISEPPKSPVDALLQKAILDIGHLATVSSQPKNQRRFSLIDSLDWSKLSPVPDPLDKPEESKSSPAPSTQKHEAKPAFLPLESNTPLDPSLAVKLYRKYLTPLEQSEILSFNQVYFLGLRAEKVQYDELGANSGYDDENSDYRVVIGDHILYRYEILECAGKGSFGKVLRCFDHKAREHVAVKIIKNSRRFHRQVQSEIDMLLRLSTIPTRHSITLKDHFTFREHYCLSFELLNASLYDHLKQNHFRGFQPTYVRGIARQLVRGLVELKRARIIHCDIKPENVLFTSRTRTETRIIDFGSACLENTQAYSYIQSRFYRSPEVILGCKYSYPIDIWSLGCVTAELVTGRPLFPGENEKDQLIWIMSCIGEPPRAVLERASKANQFFTSSGEPRICPNSKGVRRTPSSTSLKKMIPEASPTLLDFISGCLQWEPDDRMTPEQADSHPFLADARGK